jgi:hypothetical protein
MTTSDQPTTAPVPAWVPAVRALAHVVLAVVAATGAALSYKSLYLGASDAFDGSVLAYGFPLLVDALVLGASLQYVAGCRTRSAGRHGWRVTAHAGIAGTIALNALAAGSVTKVPWHVVAPTVWAVLVELYARTAAGSWRATRDDLDTIPVRLWLTAPLESARTWLHQARTSAAVGARRDSAVLVAARTALRLSTPRLRGRRVRRALSRQLRSGALDPAAVLTACAPGAAGRLPSPEAILRAAVASVIHRDTPHTPGLPLPPVGRDAGSTVPPRSARPKPPQRRPAKTGALAVQVEAAADPVDTTVRVIRAAEAAGQAARRDEVLSLVRQLGHRMGGDEARQVWAAARDEITSVNGSA